MFQYVLALRKTELKEFFLIEVLDNLREKGLVIWVNMTSAMTMNSAGEAERETD
jgi:hypothetical protein